MKVTLVLSVLLAVAYGGVPNPREDVTAFGYIARVGIPLAEKIRKYEEEKLQKEPNRIIGGEPTPLGWIPYQAGLITDMIGVTSGNGICGASLVAKTKLITAAHCWFDGQNLAWKVTVVLGTELIFHGGIRIQTTRVVMHPEWFPNLVRNDIAIIHLPQEVSFSNEISPVALPFNYVDEDFAGEKGVASGFGRKADGASLPNDQFLSHVELDIISNYRCFIFFPLFLKDSNICTSGISRSGTCQGDSGGPLTVQRDGVDVLVGVTSFGSPLGCESVMPAAYVRVTSYIDFIQENLNN